MTDAEKKIAYGRLEQRELEYMKLVGTPALDRLLFAVLKVRYDARRGAVADRINTLAEWTGMGGRAVQRGLDRLQRAGLIERKRRGVSGGTRGSATVTWTTDVRPHEAWPTGPLEQLITGRTIALDAYRSVFLCNGHAPPASPSPEACVTDTPGGDEGHACSDRRTRLATRDNQASSQEISQERGHALPVRKDEGTDAEYLEGLAERWKRDRLAAGYDRFVDRRALTVLRHLAGELLAAGAERRDLERAIGLKVAAKWADTRELGEWVAEAGTAREDAEKAARRNREFFERQDREDRERAERIAKEQADPGYKSRIAAMKADFDTRLRASVPA